MLKIAVLGAGHLGKIHLRLLSEIPEFDLIGFYDPNEENAVEVAKQFNLHRFKSIDELIDATDVVDIVTPTLSHFECANLAIRKSKHVFIEKPLTNTLEEGKELMQLIAEANVKGQVGHVERFNPAFLAAKQYNINPLFIEIHRLAEFNPRGTDVPVVLDLMIHDIDIILSLVKSNVKNIQANGVAVISDSPDIATARIEFDNGAVANLTTSRISLKKMRKARFFQKNAYITVDFLNKKVEAFKIDEEEANHKSPFAFELNPGNGKTSKWVSYESPAVSEINAIKYELELFAQSILHNLPTAVSIEEGYNSLKVAYQILDKINNSNVISS